MIELSSVTAPAYRVHDPKWAFMPISGAGAGEHGGRLNRIGVSALYLSLEEATAMVEYKQLSALMPPGLIVSYSLNVHRIIDFRQGYGAGWDSLWQEFYCDGRKIWFNERIEPPTWHLGDLVIGAGAKGILFRSMESPKGTNLVLYTDTLDAQDELSVFDPYHQLPRDGHSWR
ncbi:RES family NAD+ phosphorylase [Halomonas dongshanensis]|uniref:RES family NAD+ phosphorylase n=1 Tax=Halomonas dongshanensis TaxID=2890835 RepID=A0ABT2EA69_9GAMM|nr:RES family NAD+ phosphorylase [Halomonas dongshanensis]MCS2608456.1 RES family NAD+ phosphorylase [Halomonas dongshanensis]